MSMFFFRLHNLRREEENKRRQQKRRQNNFRRSPLTLAPSRLFEKTPLTPSDSLDEIALKIPRLVWYLSSSYKVYVNTFTRDFRTKR
ncbi:hypothetical protein M8J77_018066 [Diaphorina citri]|nr:hypothetical protein M8J77_018066 [Diaphorina citri]